MEEKIMEIIDLKIIEIFRQLQQENSISNGDIRPEDSLELEELEEKIAKLIARVIEYEK